MLNVRIKRLSPSELKGFFVDAQQGKEESRELVYAFLRSRLLALARYRVPEAAEDVVQDALIVVHNHFSEFTTLEGLFAFTNQVLRNKIGNVYQGRRRQKYVGLEEAESGYHINSELQGVELERIVQESIHKLGESRPGCMEILSFLYQGLDPAEISTRLGIAKSRLKVRTFRCRLALRDILKREYRLEV